jgi:hypothetical protein
MASAQLLQGASVQYKCSKCDKLYKSEARLQQHKSKKHGMLNDNTTNTTLENSHIIGISSEIKLEPSVNNIIHKTAISQDQITKTEIINKAALEYIIKNWDCLQFRPSVEEETHEWDPYKICKEYLDRLDNNNEKTTFYKQKNLQGRFFALKGLSLQSMPREVRHTIAAEYYWDLDFQNCHPQLLFQYCQKNNIECVQLKYYIANRETCINELIKLNAEMDKTKAKQVILAIMNGGEKDYKSVVKKSTWLKLYYCEIKEILATISQLNKPAFELRKKANIANKKDYNHEGSYVNTILCGLENEAVQYLDKYLTSKGFIVDVLVFDGLMVRKQDGLSITTSLLDESSQFIYSRIGYKLTIVEKEMNEGFNIDKSLLITKYETWKTQFELTNCKIKNLTCYLEIDIIDKKPIFRSQSELLEVYKNCEYIQDWINDKNIKTYRKLDFLPPPLLQPIDVYNVFSGFEVQSINNIIYDETSIQPILKHISYLVNHEPANINYILNWLANIFQTPGKLTNTAIIIKSNEGVGKNILFNFLKSIIGEEYCIGTADPERDCFGNFNNLLMNKILINLNETKQEDTGKYIELIKSYITENKLQLKLKNKDSLTVNNFIRWIFFTNRELPIKLPKGQRRFWGVESDSSMANNKEYMTNLVTSCESNIAKFSFYTYLMNRDISQFDFINDRPHTNFTAQMESAGSDKIQEFLQHLKESQSDVIKQNNNTFTISTSALYKEYCNFLVDNCDMEKISITAFGLALKKYKQISKIRQISGVMICINYN